MLEESILKAVIELRDEMRERVSALEKRMGAMENELTNIKSHLRMLQLREDTGLSMLLSPGQQASIGVSGFDIE